MRSAARLLPGWARPVLGYLLRRRRSVLVFGLATVLAVVGLAAFGPAAARDVSSRAALPTTGTEPTVGALFTLAGGKLGTHFCTASVVDSPHGDLVVTAAHCVTGRAAEQMAFVPGYSHGHAPLGIWRVTRVVTDQQWQTSADPNDDFAFLVVKQPGRHRTAVEDLTGGEALGIGMPAGRQVEVSGYPDDLDAPIICANTAIAYSTTQFQFDCDGFSDGTSGSPLLAAPSVPGGLDVVIGVIGGYEKGGSTSSVSYATRFNTRTEALYQTALAES